GPARLEREAATQSRSRSGHRRRVLPWVALAVVVAIGGAAVVHRRPVWRVVYFRTTLLAEPVASDLSANLGDNWGYGSPHRDVPSDGFSARWETCMVLDRPHAFEFVLGSDDGARLFVDDQMLVGQWKNQEYTEQSASVELGAGKHGMRVEHFDSGGPAELTLRARIDGKGPPRPLPRSFLRAPGHGAGPGDGAPPGGTRRPRGRRRGRACSRLRISRDGRAHDTVPPHRPWLLRAARRGLRRRTRRPRSAARSRDVGRGRPRTILGPQPAPRQALSLLGPSPRPHRRRPSAMVRDLGAGRSVDHRLRAGKDRTWRDAPRPGEAAFLPRSRVVAHLDGGRHARVRRTSHAHLCSASGL